MKIGIIGAGTMGLTLGHRLGKEGHEVTILEAAPQPGGLATWFDYGDFTWDKFYHVMLDADEDLHGLISELGIADKFRTATTKSGFLWRGRHLSMSNNFEFLTFPALNIFEKARLAIGILYVQRIEDAEPLERIHASDWLRKIFGRRVYEAIWEPLLESKYGVLKDEMPATIMWATIRRYYSTRSKSSGAESMGYLEGGLKTLFDALVQSIGANGGRVICGAPVRSIDNCRPEKACLHTDDATYIFDRVISTVPNAQLNKIAPHLLGIEPNETARPKFLGVTCLALVLKKQLSPYYVTNLIQKGFPFTGIIEVSALTGPEAMNGKHLVMLPRYDVSDSEWFDKPDDEIAMRFIGALQKVWPDIDTHIERTFVHRERVVQAIWIDSPPATQEPSRSLDGMVWNVNAELAGRDTLNNNAIVGVANRVADQMMADFGGARIESVEAAASAEEPALALASGE